MSRAQHAYIGLTREQRTKIKAHLDAHNAARGSRSEDKRDGWSIYRQPTTIDPPTTLRLHRRDANGKLTQVISITEPKSWPAR